MVDGAWKVAEGWAERLAGAGLASGADVLARAFVVRDLPDRQNLRLEVDGALVHVKRTKGGRGRRSGTSSEAAWTRTAAALGLPVAPWVFEGADGEGGALVGHLDVGPARPLDAWWDDPSLAGAARRRLLRQLAGLAARLHAAGLHHRDFYANHVYVDPSRAAPVVAILDWERAGRHRTAFGRRVVKDLAALDASCPDRCVSEDERGRFLAAYLRGRGVDPRARLRPLARRVRRKARRIRRHVPRTPVGDAARPGGGP